VLTPPPNCRRRRAPTPSASPSASASTPRATAAAPAPAARAAAAAWRGCGRRRCRCARGPSGRPTAALCARRRFFYRPGRASPTSTLHPSSTPSTPPHPTLLSRQATGCLLDSDAHYANCAPLVLTAPNGTRFEFKGERGRRGRGKEGCRARRRVDVLACVCTATKTAWPPPSRLPGSPRPPSRPSWPSRLPPRRARRGQGRLRRRRAALATRRRRRPRRRHRRRAARQPGAARGAVRGAATLGAPRAAHVLPAICPACGAAARFARARGRPLHPHPTHRLPVPTSPPPQLLSPARSLVVQYYDGKLVPEDDLAAPPTRDVSLAPPPPDAPPGAVLAPAPAAGGGGGGAAGRGVVMNREVTEDQLYTHVSPAGARAARPRSLSARMAPAVLLGTGAASHRSRPRLLPAHAALSPSPQSPPAPSPTLTPALPPPPPRRCRRRARRAARQGPARPGGARAW
jgi:hypothetical protein